MTRWMRGLWVGCVCVAVAAAGWLSGCASRQPPDAVVTQPKHAAAGRGSVIATVHPLASEAAARAYRRGGNAIDAAVAAALMLGVVDTHNSGIGGGCFMLVRRADGGIVALDGREMAPAAAHTDMFMRDGRAVPALSLTGPLASGVPGSLAVYDRALRSMGRLPLADLLRDAADIAEEGFYLDRNYATRLRGVRDDLAKFEASRAIFLDPQGRAWPPFHHLKQPDLARTYRAIADQGIGWFYGGPFGQATEQWMKANGGLLTAADFASYRVVQRQPVRSTYRGYEIIGMPPPSSGGIAVAQTLNVLEQFDLAALHDREPALRYHVTAEAMKLTFADRMHWLGDPAYAAVPRGLTDDDYARRLAAKIELDRVLPANTPHDTPPAHDADTFGKHTTHIAAADIDGNVVALTTTVNTAFGSKVVIPGTGVILNNQMDDFSSTPGRYGSHANDVASGKRPLSSMSPTIVMRDGRVVMTLGAAGGRTIINQVVMAITNRLDLGMPLPEAVAAPRIHHQWDPHELVVEGHIAESIAARLRELGHTVEVRNTFGVLQAAEVLSGDPRAGWLGVHDPRVEGKVIIVE